MVMMTIILPSVLFSAISHSLALDGSSSLRAPVDTVRLVFFFLPWNVCDSSKHPAYARPGRYTRSNVQYFRCNRVVARWGSQEVLRLLLLLFQNERNAIEGSCLFFLFLSLPFLFFRWHCSVLVWHFCDIYNCTERREKREERREKQKPLRMI